MVWRGEAQGVVEHRLGGVTLPVGTTNRNRNRMAFAQFPDSYRVRLLALREGDPVRVAGTILYPDADGPKLSATNLWVEVP